MDELTSAARQEDGVEFYMTSDEDVAAVFGLEKETKPALVLLKNVPDKRLVFSKCETFNPSHLSFSFMVFVDQSFHLC